MTLLLLANKSSSFICTYSKLFSTVSASRLQAGFGKQSKPTTNTKDNNKPPKPLKNKLENNTTFIPKFPNVTEPYQNHLISLNTAYPNMRQIYYDPPIYEIDNFFTNEECLSYITRSQELGFEINSQTFSVNAASKRTSTTWFLKYSDVPELTSRAMQLLNLHIQHFEEPQVVRYEFGQQFTWHYDAIPRIQLDSSGNRLVTLLVYLNNVTNGGSTCFKDLNIQVKPTQGKALVFFPCYRDGTNDERTMHAGQVAMDTKWIAQMYVSLYYYCYTFILYMVYSMLSILCYILFIVYVYDKWLMVFCRMNRLGGSMSEHMRLPCLRVLTMLTG